MTEYRTGYSNRSDDKVRLVKRTADEPFRKFSLNEPVRTRCSDKTPWYDKKNKHSL